MSINTNPGDNTSNLDASTSANCVQFVTRERWEAALEYKEDFLRNRSEYPHDPLKIDPRVVTSWIRSREKGINPFAPILDKYLDSEELEIVLNRNHLLIDTCKTLFDTFKNLADSSGYLLYLFDKDGVLLLVEGKMPYFPSGPDHYSLVGKPGRICNETTMGTCAHSLSTQYKCPIQLIGPEHYCVTYNNLIASSAPIQDENREVIATLVLNQALTNPLGDNNYQELCSHTLSLITAMAAAVEAQINLQQSREYIISINASLKSTNDKLKTAYDTLEATLDCVDEGIITVDQSGRIIRINREGLRILKLRPEEIGNRNIQDFLDKQSVLMNLASRGESTSIEETIYTDNDEQPYVLDIRPVLDQDTHQLNAAVLRLNHAEKINALVTSRSGATASYNFEDIIAESDAMRKAIEMGKRFAGSQENILLIGESGTGKELLAQSIHNKCHYAGPFMAVNCAALPRELIESELFGYEGGSFTGADRSGRPGKIELANGGTLFLDEIGDMPLELQPVLLRVIEDKQVMRIGGRRYKKVNFRVIAATNKNLYKMVQDGLFREDLFFRLSVLSINIPPLRARENDIELLSRYFIENYCRKLGKKVPLMSPATLKKIKEYQWPGNVRQLENAMIYAVNTAQGNIIEPDNLPETILEGNYLQVDEMAVNKVTSRDLTMKSWEKAGIEVALLRTNNNIPLAADLLEISKATLYRKIKEYKIQS